MITSCAITVPDEVKRRRLSHNKHNKRMTTMSQTMQAMVYHGANDIRFEQRPRPQILQPTDALIRVTKSTICGTDLGI